MAEIVTLPIWKKDATAYERLSELAMLAREHPEYFETFVIVYRGTLPCGNWRVRTMEHGSDLAGWIGLMELGKNKIIDSSEG